MQKYQESFQCWQAWAESKGLCSLPATGQEVALYVAFVLQTAKTIHSAIYGIAWAHKKAEKTAPTEHTQVKQMVEASKRIVGVKSMNRKQPLEAKHVKEIIAKFGEGNLGQLQIATLQSRKIT